MASVKTTRLKTAVIELQVTQRELSRLRFETLDLYIKLDAIERRLDNKVIADPELVALKREIRIREQAYQELEHKVRGLVATIKEERSKS